MAKAIDESLDTDEHSMAGLDEAKFDEESMLRNVSVSESTLIVNQQSIKI